MANGSGASTGSQASRAKKRGRARVTETNYRNRVKGSFEAIKERLGDGAAHCRGKASVISLFLDKTDQVKQKLFDAVNTLGIPSNNIDDPADNVDALQRAYR